MKQILCYGDSNTWGLIPGTQERYPWGVRWTSLLQEQLKKRDVRIIEDGLCGRTTVFEDAVRKHRNGLSRLSLALEVHAPLDAAILMLGTNDCKICYRQTARQIAAGAEQCVDLLLQVLPSEKILLVSPIELGQQVWLPEYDPAFDEESVEVSKGLKDAYRELAGRKGIRFLAASDYAEPGETDHEHMASEGHAALAAAIIDSVGREWLI